VASYLEDTAPEELGKIMTGKSNGQAPLVFGTRFCISRALGDQDPFEETKETFYDISVK
jgi:hypothetical protein